MKRVLVVVALLVLAVVGFVARRGAAPPRGVAGGHDASPRSSPAATLTPQATSAEATPPAAKPPARRVLVPRPPAATAPPPRAPKLVRGGELADRREGPRAPDAEEQREAIMAAMDEVEDDVEECLQAWAELDPDFHGQVALTFEVDQEGLGKLWITDHQKVPEGPMTCFASAVYSVDWSNLTDKPIELSNRFVVADGQPAQVDVSGPATP